MSLTDDYLFGNPTLHAHFCRATEILAALISVAPQPVGMSALAQQTGYPQKDLATMCSSLWQAMLITPDADGEGWILNHPAHQLTLEDVLRCTLENQKPRTVAVASGAPRQHLRPDVDILVSQATLAINQAVFAQLRKFPLSRLRFDGTGAARFNPHFLNGSGYDADSEPVAFSDIVLISPLS